MMIACDPMAKLFAGPARGASRFDSVHRARREGDSNDAGPAGRRLYGGHFTAINTGGTVYRMDDCADSSASRVSLAASERFRTFSPESKLA